MEWIKVEDRFPESGQEVILSYYYNTDNYLSVSAAQYWDFYDGKYFRVLMDNKRTDEYKHIYKPMFWMDMPEAPAS